MPPQKAMTLRMPQTTYDVIAAEARRQKCSVSMFVREAAFGRAMFHMGARNGEAAEAMERMLEEAHRLLEAAKDESC
jgi:hypothetical protein